jgi:hypothetical protein
MGETMEPLPWDYLPLSYVIGFLPFLLINLSLIKLAMKMNLRPWTATIIISCLNEYVLFAWWTPISRVLAAGYDWVEFGLVTFL